jgi:signal transduction histidine kinase
MRRIRRYIPLLCLLVFGSNAYTLLCLEDQNKERVLRQIKTGDSLYSNKPDSAITYYLNAAVLADSLSFLPEQATAIFGMAKSYYVKADYLLSLENFQKALKIQQSLNNTEGIIFGLNGCGIALTMLNKEREAIAMHRQAIVLCNEINDQKQLAKNLFNISVSYESLKMIDSSLVYVDSALELASDYETVNMKCKYANHKGQLQILNGQAADAVNTFEKTLNTEGFDNQWEIQYSIAGLGKAHMHLGQLEKSLEYSHKAFEMAESIDSKWDLKEVSETLSKTYELKEDFKLAFEYHKLFKNYSDELFNEAKEKELNAHLLKEEKLINENLQSKNNLYLKQVDRKNKLIIAFSIILLAILVTILFYVRLYRSKIKLLAQLEELNATKDKLFRIIAHDLKTPISVVIQFTELLQENLDTYDKDTIQKFLSLLNKSSRSGFDLLSNLMTWAQSQTGGIPFEPQELNVEKILESSWNLLASQAELKNIHLVTDIPENQKVVADEDLLRIVLRNLLSNAIKFSYPGDQVTCKTWVEENDLIFGIQDNGIGFAEEIKNFAFKTAAQISRPGTNEEQGTGLGLVICKEFVERHQGRIWIEKTQPGTLICFSIPLSSY